MKMELKRYVLNQKNEIIDVQKQDEKIEVVDDNNLMFTNKHGWRFEGKCIKTSDNILNLLEPCTLWDLSGDLFEEHLNDNWVFINKYFSDTDFSNRSKDAKVVAIYKRQSNGDFKKYEVKA